MTETSSSGCAADSPPPESTKLFVGGIHEGLKEEEIRDHFAKFGDVREVVVVKDKATGNVRGFGFVEFADPAAAEAALKEKEHAVGERTVEVKRARPRGEQRRHNQSPQYQYHSNCSNTENPVKTNKIFVGGLSSNITQDDFKTYFEKFGRITDVVIMYDNSTQRPRGFGFITFDSVEAVDSVLQQKFHQLNNKTVEVKLAIPKDGNNQNNMNDSNGGLGFCRGPALNKDQRGYYPPYSPRYGVYPGYAPPLVPGFYYGTAGYGYYGGFAYYPPVAGARCPYNGPGIMGARRSPVPYGGMHPGYGYGGYAAMNAGGYNGYMWPGNDKLNQADSDARTMDHSEENAGSEKLDVQQVSRLVD